VSSNTVNVRGQSTSPVASSGSSRTSMSSHGGVRVARRVPCRDLPVAVRGLYDELKSSSWPANRGWLVWGRLFVCPTTFPHAALEADGAGFPLPACTSRMPWYGTSEFGIYTASQSSARDY
jgi:hypothetical protein